MTEEREDVDVGKIGAEDEGGGGVAGAAAETAFAQRQPDEGMAEIVHWSVGRLVGSSVRRLVG